MKRFIAVILTLIITASFCGCASMGGVREEKGITDTKRIASASVAICEILNELGYENVVGIPETSTGRIPEKYQNAETIGAPMTPDYEKIKDIAPDLVLSPKSLESTLAPDYSSAGINSAFQDLSSVEGMYTASDSLGDLLGKQTEAKKLHDDYKAYMQSYTVSGKDAPNILFSPDIAAKLW